MSHACVLGATCPSHPFVCSGLSGSGWLWWSAATPQESDRRVPCLRFWGILPHPPGCLRQANSLSRKDLPSACPDARIISDG